MKYTVTLTHTEIITVEAEDENDALRQAFDLADTNCFWDEVEIEEED